MSSGLIVIDHKLSGNHRNINSLHKSMNLNLSRKIITSNQVPLSTFSVGTLAAKQIPATV